MRIHGRVVDTNGAAVVGARVEVRGTATARVRILPDDTRGHHRPEVGTATRTTDPVEVTTGPDGGFMAAPPTPQFASDDDEGRIVGAPTYGATARAVSSIGETLATAHAEHATHPDLDLGTLHLPTARPAFQTGSLGNTIELGPHQSRRVAEIVAVGAGPLTLGAFTLKRVVEPPDETHLKPIFVWEQDQPAEVQAFALEGTGSSLKGLGSAHVQVAATDGGPRHTWVLVVRNPTAHHARIEWSASYTTTHPIKTKPVKISDLNTAVSRLLQLGPNDSADPPIRIVIGQELKIVVRPDWQEFFGSLSGYQVPGFVQIKTTANVRPVIEFRQSGDDLVLVMNLKCDVGSIKADVVGSWFASVTASDLDVTFTFTFDVQRQLIVPICAGATDARLDTDAGPGLIALDIVTLGISQAIADKVASGVTDALRTAVRTDIPTNLNGKRFKFGKSISSAFVGPDRPVLGLKADNGTVFVTYVDDEHDPLLSLDPEAPDPKLVGKIDHVVVLMMENRSFDHMLGYLKRDKGRDEIDGLLRPDARGNTGQFNEFNGEQFQPFKLTDTQVPVDVDPCHGSACVAAQINGPNGPMTGFVDSFARRIGEHPGARSKPQDMMGYHGAEHVWAYDAIAESFAVCDRWFSSHPGPTWPNRYFMISCHLGTSPQGGPDVDMTGDPTPIDLDTIFDELTRRKVSWRYFEHDVGFIRKIAKYTLDFENVVTIDHPVTGFYALAAKGALPSVTFIDPNFIDFPDGRPSNDDHPPTDIAPGQELVAQIYNALRASPQWERTLFVITYDEHGGLYDHYPPPTAPAPPGSFATLGVRVPALVISPWIPARSVSHEMFDHTVVAKTIFRRFTPEAMPDLSVRFRAAADLGSLLSLEQVRTDAIPAITRPANVPPPKPRAPVPIAADDPLRQQMAALRKLVDVRRPR